jgi:3-oxoacyl-[acyl-carrier protein] reductase
VLELRGRGVIIAGTRRVGATVVDRLALEGLRLAILYRTSAGEAMAQATRSLDYTDKAIALQADLVFEDQVEKAVLRARQELGNISYCINLAYDYPRVSFDDLDLDAWEKGMSGAKGNYLLSIHAARAMMHNDGPTRGQIVMFGDWAAEETPYLDFLPYLTGKAAVHFMTRAFAAELGGRGILVNAILPGPTAKPPDLSDRGWQIALDQAPLHRESSEDEIAELIVTLLKLETMTGETIHVDSGRHIAGTAVRKSRADEY